MESFIANFDLNQLVLFLVGIGIFLQRMKTVEKAVDTVADSVTALDTKFSTAIERRENKVDDSLSRMHTRVNQNHADINRHEGIFQTILPEHKVHRRIHKQPQGSSAD